MKHLTPLADSTDRPAWLEARRHVITASQVSTIAGSNPYTGIVDLWNEKNDPTWTEDRNWRLDERAAYGRMREPHILEWAGDDPQIGGRLTPNTTLYCHPDRPGEACTPDAWRVSKRKDGDVLIVVDAKATETDWLTKGVPQYIVDQMLWTWRVTGCQRIFLAVERVKWTKGTPTTIDRYVIEIPLDAGAQRRLDFLLEQVDLFQQMLEDGIAPESDIDMRAIGFDTDPADAVLFSTTDALLDQIAEIEDRIGADVKLLADLKAQVKAAATEFHGRRVHLIGTRRIAKLVRFWTAKPDYSQIDPREVAAVTSWVPSDRLVIEANPEWSADG